MANNKQYNEFQCPHCGSDDIIGEEVCNEGDCFLRSCFCNACDSSWSEILEPTSYVNLSVGKKAKNAI